MKEKYTELANRIIQNLETELPERHCNILINFKQLIEQDKFRASYAELDRLMHLQDWTPSNNLKNLIIKYRIVF